MQQAVPSLIFAILALSACASDGLGPNSNSTGVSLVVQATVIGTVIAGMSVEVAGPGIPIPITKNLALANGTASGTVTVPAGSDRTFTVRGFNARALETHRGSTTVTVAEGMNASVPVVVTPLTGGVPITATVGFYNVAVSPVTDTVQVGDTILFNAVVLDAEGNTIQSAALEWASENPIVAEVDATGRVVAGYAGSTRVVANYSGVSGVANLVVQ